MAVPVIMPRQGQSVESCIIAKWHKKKGDAVKEGDILFSYETDKASFDEEAKAEGILLDVFFAEGDDVPCLTNVCVIGSAGESAAGFSPSAGAAAEAGEAAAQAGGAGAGAAAAAPAAAAAAAAPAATAATAADGRVNISPRARNLAEKTGVDYRFATPTGPNNRIIEQDIISLRASGNTATFAARDGLSMDTRGHDLQGTGLGGRITTGGLERASSQGTAGSAAAAQAAQTGSATSQITQAGAASQQAQAAAGPAFEEVKIPNIRKLIAKAMHNSLSTTAQLTLNASFDATDILAFRKKLKEGKDRLGLENITLNDIILFAVSRTLLGHRDLNAHFLDDRMLYFRDVNLGVAVDTDRGLMVPTVFSANLKSLNEISAEVKKLAKECQAGTINPDLIKGGSFTVTNLGTFDIESFTPVLNPPQTGILGVDCIVQRAREKDGEYEFYPAMGLSLTFDHRAVDGAPAAKFLKDLKNNLENFTALLAR